MGRTISIARKIIVSLIGFPLLVIGVILVPLPGPGFLGIFLAMVLLSTQFEWTKKYVTQLQSKLKKLHATAQGKADAIAEPRSKK